MTNKNRHDFSKKTVEQIAKRAGWLCSFRSCRKQTIGATADGNGEINIGTAAHICAASPDGPRYDPNMSKEERSSAGNGIWLCRDHGKAIDSDVAQFPVDLLREWKRAAELESFRRVLHGGAAELPLLVANQSLYDRIRKAAGEDLAAFRRTAKWPGTSVSLQLEIEGFDEPVSTDAMARAVASFDDFIIVAGPGMGKTTTLFQIAEHLLEKAGMAPFVVLLNDWAADRSDLLESILMRPALADISEADFRAASAASGVVLLLDGWNELSDDARRRARPQIEGLMARLPELRFIVSTRKPRNQALDISFSAKRVDLLPLSEDTQMQIARALRGDDGASMVERAWRTSGVRELVAIPLYLTSLLSLPSAAPIPRTKEEVLRHFVAAHEAEPGRVDAIYAVLQDFQTAYLEGLAVAATRMSSTTIDDAGARRAISAVSRSLIESAQIVTAPEPNAVLDALVGRHVLMRPGEAPGVSFQHQQFQEWYASHYVERLMLAAVHGGDELDALREEVLNFPVWEEAILFAVERMARGNALVRAACAKAILSAFEIDPILASEMIARSSDDVWAIIRLEIMGLVRRWHRAGSIDRGFRFMLMTGRPDFFEMVWPLLTNEDQQVSLRALRSCRRFRPAILGNDAASRIRALPAKPREILLCEIAANSGMDGLDLVAAIAAADPEPYVKAAAIDALSFRYADRHIALVLRDAEEETFDLIWYRGVADHLPDEHIQQRLQAARIRCNAKRTSPEERLRRIATSSPTIDHSVELRTLISSMPFGEQHGDSARLLHAAFGSYPDAIADGLLARVRAGLDIPFFARSMLASGKFSLEEEDLRETALALSDGNDRHAEDAASVLGPSAAKAMVEAFFGLLARPRADRTVVAEYERLERRLDRVPWASLISASVALSETLKIEQIAHLADLLSRRFELAREGIIPPETSEADTIRGLVRNWGSRMLASGSARRSQTSAVARLARYVADKTLVPIVKELLDDNLKRLRRFRAQAEASGWGDDKAVSEARMPMTEVYQRTFSALKSPEITSLMRRYLVDEDFGREASLVLAEQWRSANEAPDQGIRRDIPWSRVAERRATLEKGSVATCEEAEAIFSAIETLTGDGTSSQQRRLAMSLAVTGLRLPHGDHASTVRRLISFATSAHDALVADLLLSLVLSGHDIDADVVVAGVASTLKAMKRESWRINRGEEDYSLRAWLHLLPFMDKPLLAVPALIEVVTVTAGMHHLRAALAAYAHAPTPEAEEALFKLAEQNAAFYRQPDWQDSAIALGTETSVRRLIDLLVRGTFDDNRSLDTWHWTARLRTIFSDHPQLREHVYELLRNGANTPGLRVLASIVAEDPDEEGLFVLMNCRNAVHSSRLRRLIERVITKRTSVDGSEYLYNIEPTVAADFRRKLLALVVDGGPTDTAAKWLDCVDAIRDEYGFPNEEPRHPDLKSGKPWPFLRSGSASESGDR